MSRRFPSTPERFLIFFMGATLALIAAGCGSTEPPAAAEPDEPAAPVSVVAPGATPELVKDGFSFTEGPVQGPDGNIYFTDVRENRIHRILSDGSVETYLENTQGANGLAFDRSGRLIAAQGGTGQIVAFEAGGKVTVLAKGAESDQMRPNDLILDSQGGMFFSDPGPPGVPESPTRKHRVWYLPAGGEMQLVTDQAGRANGLTLTLDGRTLLIADSNGPQVFAMDVQNGTTTNLRRWAELRDIPEGERSAADGVAIDSDGRLYVTTVAGVQVFDSSGMYLETITFPQQAANIAFGGEDRKMLYATARTGVYRLRMNTAGPADRAK